MQDQESPEGAEKAGDHNAPLPEAVGEKLAASESHHAAADEENEVDDEPEEIQHSFSLPQVLDPYYKCLLAMRLGKVKDAEIFLRILRNNVLGQYVVIDPLEAHAVIPVKIGKREHELKIMVIGPKHPSLETCIMFSCKLDDKEIDLRKITKQEGEMLQAHVARLVKTAREMKPNEARTEVFPTPETVN